MPFDQAALEAPPPLASLTAALPADDVPALRDWDRRLRGRMAMLTGGQSPWAAIQALQDWGFHLATSPGRQIELWQIALRTAMSLSQCAASGTAGDWAFKPTPMDRRFRNEAWRRAPFNLFEQIQLAMEAQWRAATHDLRGAEEHHLRRVEFLGQFVLNALAPVNCPWTNPEIIDAAMASGGQNFAKGGALFGEDVSRLNKGGKLTGLDQFRVGQTMAVTPGQVIFRNNLMELIQYAPTTAAVHREPILIVPAWIMKYYILDLSPESSLVRHLVGQGYTVFIVSWRNPGAEDRDTSLEDYRRNGIEAALDAVAKVVPGEKVHAVGYCLGGTMLAITAADMDRDNNDRLASLSLLAAQTDFEEAGELMLFIDESQLSLLEDMMLVQGYLDARQMAGAFYALRTNEMLWSQIVERYLIASPRPLTELDAWLADSTRMPALMHSQYLRQLFLQNSFSHGRYEVDSQAVALKDIRTPVFALGAERDHIAPWRSVYKIELYSSADTTFILTGGGHNTSVVSPPSKPGAYYRVRASKGRAAYLEPDIWMASATREDGSWWPAWVDWLKRLTSPGKVAPPQMGAPDQGLNPIIAAPGRYVMEH
jgi:polyhydroxyalkanoate synthase